MPKVLLIAWERFSETKHAFTDKQYQPEEIQELMCKLLEDVRNINKELAEYINSLSWNRPTLYNDDEEHSIQYKEYLENSSNAITTVLPTEEPEYSLSMGECEVTFDNESECDVPVCEGSSTFDVLKDYSEILSDSNNDDTSKGENDVYQEEKDIDLEDILQIQDVILRKKLLSINRLIADIEFLNDNPTPNRVLKSSSSFHIFEKSDNSLSYLDNSLPEFEIFSDHTKETRSGSTTAHANNFPPEYDSFCFEIEPDQRRLTSVVMNDICDNSTNDPLLEAVELFLVSDNLIPPGIENIDYNSEGDICFLEELLSNDSFPLPKNESSNFDHHDDPSFPRPPPKPPDVEIFFEPDTGVLTTNMVKGISEHYVLMPNIFPTLPTLDPDLDFIPSHDSLGSENKIFDPEIFIEVQSERLLSREEFSISFICNPLYLVYDTLLMFSSENEDKVFKPGILSYLLVSHQDKTTSDFSKNPMMMYGEDIPLLDVPDLHTIPMDK
nr:hypothetical protein [Tanacetum cinerariifolium]